MNKKPYTSIEDAYEEIDRLYESLGTVDKIRFRFKEKHGKAYSSSRNSINKLNKVRNRIRKTLKKRGASAQKSSSSSAINTMFIPGSIRRINLVFERAEEVSKLSLIKPLVDFCAENNYSIRIITRDDAVNPSSFLKEVATKNLFDFYTDSPLRASLQVRKLDITRGDIFIATSQKTLEALSKMHIPSRIIFSCVPLSDEFRTSKHYREIDNNITTNQLGRLFDE
jgi:hypothetical protein